jgi:hypothetical protein
MSCTESKTVAVLGIDGSREEGVVVVVPGVVPGVGGVVVPDDVPVVGVPDEAVVGAVDGVVTGGVAAAIELLVMEPPHPMKARADKRITAKQAFRMVLPCKGDESSSGTGAAQWARRPRYSGRTT